MHDHPLTTTIRQSESTRENFRHDAGVPNENQAFHMITPIATVKKTLKI
jgi:hypothetical protein